MMCKEGGGVYRRCCPPNPEDLVFGRREENKEGKENKNQQTNKQIYFANWSRVKVQRSRAASEAEAEEEGLFGARLSLSLSLWRCGHTHCEKSYMCVYNHNMLSLPQEQRRGREG